jgi:hypothetical protein
MYKQLVIGLVVIGALAVWRTDANAGCIPLGDGSLYCASWITGSGDPTGLVTQKPNGSTPVTTFNNNACGDVFTTSPCSGYECEGEGGFASFLAKTSVTNPSTSNLSPGEISFKLAGNVGKNCGLGTGQDSCDISGNAVCGNSVKKNVTTAGPLEISSPGFGQTDGSTNSANFRFQLDQNAQSALCGSDTFIAFFAREGFFETCIGDPTGGPTVDRCVQEFCKTDNGGIGQDAPRVYNCQPIKK